MGWWWVACCWQAAACLQGGPPPPSPFLLLLLLLTTPLASPASLPPPSLPSFPLPTTLAPRPHTRWPFAPPPPSLPLSLSLPSPPPSRGARICCPPFPNAARRPGCVRRGVEEGAEGGGLRVARVWVCGCRVRERATAGARPLPLPRPLALPCANGGGSGRGGRGGGRPSSPEGAGRVCGSDRGVVCGVWCVVCGVVWWGAVCVCGVRRGVVVVGGPETPACCCCCPATPRTHTHTHTHTHSTPRRGAAQPRVTYSGSRNGLCWGVCRLYLGARGWRRRRRGRRG